MTPADIAIAIRRAQSFAAIPPADVEPLLALAELAGEALRARDTWDMMSDQDPAHAHAWAQLVESERQLRAAIAPMLEPRLERALGQLGTEHQSPPAWQERVLAQVDAPTSAWQRYRLAMWIAFALVGAMIGLVALAGGAR